MQLSRQNKQVITLYGSTFLGVIVGMLNSVINTGSLTPADYGDVRYVQTVISFTSGLLLFGYFVSGSRLLAISKDEESSRRIRGIMCAILAAAILIVMVVMTIMCIINIVNCNDVLGSLFLTAIPLCGNVLMLNYIETTAQGDNHIGRISLARLLPSSIYCIVAFILFCQLGLASSRLMLILFNGTAIIVLLSIIISTRPSFKDLRSSFSVLNTENKKYGFNVYLGSVANVATSYISGITLGMFCADNSNVGFYTLAVTISLPLMMLPSIIGTTYFKKFATQNRIEGKVLRNSALLTIGSCIMYIICIKYVVAFLYNDQYQVVGEIASWLAVGMSLHGLGDMFNRFLGAHGKGREIRNGAFICGAIVVLGSTILVYFFEITGAVVTKLLSDVVYFMMMYFYYLKFASK